MLNGLFPEVVVQYLRGGDYGGSGSGGNGGHGGRDNEGIGSVVALFMSRIVQAGAAAYLAKMMECAGGGGGGGVLVVVRCLAGGKESENGEGGRKNVEGRT